MYGMHGNCYQKCSQRSYRESTDARLSPDRPNIFYETKVRTDFDTDFHDLLAFFYGITAPRVIVYCQSLNMF